MNQTDRVKAPHGLDPRGFCTGRLHTLCACIVSLRACLTIPRECYAPEHAERISDPLFTTKPDGTGLDLSISHSIVHQHGGTISVENLKGERGVTFTLTLPVAHLVKNQEITA